MLYDPSTATHLKPWLVRTLEPICDAEPGALADYILALLKHNAPENEMRKELSVQLEEFLEKETSGFIDTLFTVLRTKSYLPYTAASPSSYTPATNGHDADAGIPIPLDALMSPPSMSSSPPRGTKRPMDHDGHDERPPKDARLGGDGPYARYANGQVVPDTRAGGWAGRGGRGGMRGRIDGMGPMNGRSQGYLPPEQKRGLCRDFHNNGYCSRGAYCKYSHGDDVVIPNPMFGAMNGVQMPGPLPFMSMLANGFGMNGMGEATYDPHEARMDMRPQMGGAGGAGRGAPRAPLLHRMQTDEGTRPIRSPPTSGELPVIQDLTPAVPPEDAAPRPRPEEPAPAVENAMDVDARPGSRPMRGRPGGRGGFSGPRAPGTFNADVPNFRPERRNDKTLVVEKIPEDKLSLDAVNSWFKRFGTVTNVAVDAVNKKALVSFSNHEEAHAAWKSEDAVFNNRFVKIFWHRPLEGHGQMGARMLAASGTLVQKLSGKEAAPPSSGAPTAVEPPAPAASTSTAARKSATPSTAATALAEKQRLLEQQIAEQKSLMSKLEIAAGDEKKQIMARLRKLGEEMKPSSPTNTGPTASASSTTPQKRANSTPRPDDREQRERERLDKELDLHSATVAVDGEQEESTEDLQAKLAKLKAEAASLGITDATPSHGYHTSYRPYRGRARGGRGYYRGAPRGGAPRSLKLDNRPKKLLVKGAKADNVQAVRDWYSTTGALDSLQTLENGDLVATFKTRSGAEQAFVKGSNVPSVDHLLVTWYTGQGDAIGQHTTSPLDHDKGVHRDGLGSSDLHSSHGVEEEIVASGWGAHDEEDGMGML